MSLAVDAAMESIEAMDLSDENKEELAYRLTGSPDGYAEEITYLRVHDEGDGWVIDGQNGTTGQITAVMLKYATFEEAVQHFPELREALKKDGVRFRGEKGEYYWTGWECETEETEDGREGVYYLTIHDPQGEEYATIIHRVSAEYSLDSHVALEKIDKANAMVAALNATL